MKRLPKSFGSLKEAQKFNDESFLKMQADMGSLSLDLGLVPIVYHTDIFLLFVVC